jgi:hypothetical protein
LIRRSQFACWALARKIERQRLRSRHWQATTIGLLVLVAINSTLPQKLVGERFQALGAIALVVVLVPLCALAALLLRESDRRLS